MQVMKWTTMKAWMVGAAILVLAHALWWGVAGGSSMLKGFA
jgi:hypothetical protein